MASMFLTPSSSAKMQLEPLPVACPSAPRQSSRFGTLPAPTPGQMCAFQRSLLADRSPLPLSGGRMRLVNIPKLSVIKVVYTVVDSVDERTDCIYQLQKK